MSEYDLPPIDCSQGGFAYNGAHIEYWKARALEAESSSAAQAPSASAAEVAGFAELADIITKIDILLARTDEAAGYAAFVKMRQAWPKLRVAALRGCLESINDAPSPALPSTDSGSGK